jgi:predicted Zn-dependent protease
MHRIFSLIVFLLLAVNVYAEESLLDRSSGWIYSYGVAAGTQNSLVDRAYTVFQRVRAASILGHGEIPDLIIVAAKKTLWAVAIRDGNIILSEGALNTCYLDVTTEVGDSRLAFVLGHELAHQGNDDFWHAAAFELLQAEGDQDPVLTTLQEELEQRTQVSVQQGDQELKADIDGLIAMSMAGYNPQAIIGGKTNFFAEWVARSTGTVRPQDSAHPSPEARAHFVRTQLRPVVKALGRFRFGVRLMQAGRYEDALLLLDSFREQYPGRAVFNNMALCHYNLALREITECSPILPLRYYLPITLDPVTSAAKISLRGEGQHCLDSRSVQLHLEKSVEYLRESARIDSSYLPARINLAAVMLLSDKPAEALALTSELFKLQQDHPGIQMLKALAVYEVGKTIGADTADEALRVLHAITTENPDYSPAWYNLAAIESQRGRYGAADVSLREFLARMQTGKHAEYARQRLNVVSHTHVIKALEPPVPPPLKWDASNQEIVDALGTVKRDHLSLSLTTSFDLYESDRGSILKIGPQIDMMEVAMTSVPASKIQEQYGVPLRTYLAEKGETWVYGRFAVDIVEGNAQRIVYYPPMLNDRLRNGASIY